MALFQLTCQSINEVQPTTFAAQGVRERQDLQRLLREKINIIAGRDESLYVLTEEYGEFEGANRRIDLLCLDGNANLVVVELKRTEDGGHMELQALRYAAMISTMTFGKAVEAHAKYLRKDQVDAQSAILSFLGWKMPMNDKFAQDVRIILVAADLSIEITTAVMWLNKKGLDIRCLRFHPYTLNGEVLIDIQQVLPLPEAADYQIKFKEKDSEERVARQRSSFATIGDMIREKILSPGQKLYIHGRRDDSEATLLPDGDVSFDGEVMSANEWGTRIKRNPVSVYRHAETEHGKLLDDLRRGLSPSDSASAPVADKTEGA
jgi:hypothetical protein